MARYDYGLRGYRETAHRRPGRPWHLHAGPEDPRDEVRGYGPGGPPSPGAYRGREFRPIANRVTARYNRDYLYPDADRYEVNPNPYGGDTRWRIGDFTGYQRPYLTRGGSYTYRGGGPVGWERDAGYRAGPYRRVRRYGDDYREW